MTTEVSAPRERNYKMNPVAKGLLGGSLAAMVLAETGLLLTDLVTARQTLGVWVVAGLAAVTGTVIDERTRTRPQRPVEVGVVADQPIEPPQLQPAVELVGLEPYQPPLDEAV